MDGRTVFTRSANGHGWKHRGMDGLLIALGNAE